MEKRKWLWKKKSSERSPGETESSGSISSHSERYSDDQEAFKASPNNNAQSPEVSSKASANCEDVNDSIKSLTEKLSAALVNVSAKEDLVKQHAKVAEEAIAGWEKAENEVVLLKQKLEAAVQQNSALEDRVSHLDGALKECVRQLRQAREEQEQKINEAVAKTTRDWETTKFELESQLLELQDKAEAVKSEPPPHFSPDLWHKIEALEKENSALKLELSSQSEEFEIRTIERDLSTQAAETASKQHLESIKKVAKLEAECRRLKARACKSSLVNDHKSPVASSIYVESLTDSQSDSGERLNVVEIDTHKMSGLEANKGEPSCSDSWASALIAGLDQFKNEKVINRNLASSSIEIDLMDDFLEMERLAALPEIKSENQCVESKATAKQSSDADSSLKAELEAMIHRTAELEQKLEKIELEKAELEIALAKSQESLEASALQLRDTETKLEELEREFHMANEAKQHLEFQLSSMETDAETMSAKIDSLEAKIEKERALSAEVSVNATESKQLLESQLISIEAEARTMSAKIDSLETEVEKERALSAQITVKCQELEEELSRKRQEAELQQTANSNVEVKIKQEDLAVAAGKLAECQKTIASLGQQLKSLATLEDFLIDTTSIPEFSRGGSLIPKAGGEPWKLHSNETYSPKRDPDSPRVNADHSGPSVNKNDGNTPPSSSSSSSIVSSNHASSEKNRNGFAKFFTRSKNGIQLEI
ncbi:filament-like plant protein [Herrania umbratica]|uniref:Filament-like plant protein n=1 Tax=Herrania umbratica TaxID=108875 RepID=A0A6J1ACV0_9ROSI|nr:filament-like plant protein [Herrania umbratica]XP_021284783.1 filament-like plant protein [Herrania umbratica]XP_021284784.1 filament-like plant protein [Herrania umbratica]